MILSFSKMLFAWSVGNQSSISSVNHEPKKWLLLCLWYQRKSTEQNVFYLIFHQTIYSTYLLIMIICYLYYIFLLHKSRLQFSDFQRNSTNIWFYWYGSVAMCDSRHVTCLNDATSCLNLLQWAVVHNIYLFGKKTWPRVRKCAFQERNISAYQKMF